MASQAFDEVKDWFISYFQYISDSDGSLLYGTQTKLISIQFADCQERKRTVYDRFRGNGPYGKNLTKQNSRGYTLRLPYHIIK